MVLSFILQIIKECETLYKFVDYFIKVAYDNPHIFQRMW